MITIIIAAIAALLTIIPIGIFSIKSLNNIKRYDEGKKETKTNNKIIEGPELNRIMGYEFITQITPAKRTIIPIPDQKSSDKDRKISSTEELIPPKMGTTTGTETDKDPDNGTNKVDQSKPEKNQEDNAEGDDQAYIPSHEPIVWPSDEDNIKTIQQLAEKNNIDIKNQFFPNDNDDDDDNMQNHFNNRSNTAVWFDVNEDDMENIYNNEDELQAMIQKAETITDEESKIIEKISNTFSD